MAKNEYAKKITLAGKEAVHRMKSAIVRKCLETTWMVVCVTLNRNNGFGGQRLKQLRADFEATMNEYGVMQNDVDTDYADGKLEAAYNAIMGEAEND